MRHYVCEQFRGASWKRALIDKNRTFEMGRLFERGLIGGRALNRIITPSYKEQSLNFNNMNH